MNILGVKVDKVTKTEAIAKIADFLTLPGQFFVTTPNSEIILYARHHPKYQNILNLADLALPDGAGLLVASKILGHPLPERVSGSDMFPAICRLAREKNLKLALLGGLDQGVVDKAAAVIRGWGNNVVYAEYGVPKEHWNDPSFHEKIINGISASGADIVFAGFGHPKQEEWIDTYRLRLPKVKLLIGVGGTLDFVAGAAKRAPVWMRPWFEWLWRLIIEPARFKRIWNATVVFQFAVIYARWHNFDRHDSSQH